MVAGSTVGLPNDPPSAPVIRAAAEGLLLVLLACSPWSLGCRWPGGEFILSLGVLGFALLWAAHAVVTRRLSYRSDPVTFCLLGLVLLTAFQLVPLPESVARFLSPTAVEWRQGLTPAVPELLPGEDEAAVPRRSGWVRLSVAPWRTEDMLTRFLAIFVVYAGARNFVASDRSFNRLAWVGFGTGILLALAGMAQFLSGGRLHLYDMPPDVSAPFGPFVNKNHFAFQVLLFAGLAIGLFLRAARREGVGSPPAIGPLLGVGLMLAAVGFSQSRGGVVAAAAAALLTAGVDWWARRGRAGPRVAGAGVVLAVGAGLVALVLVAAFGGKVVTARISTLWGGAIDTRAEGWQSARPLVERFPAFGVGGGALAVAEPVVRTTPDLRVEFNTMDNEYLEAAVEGGVIRFALTVALALAAVGGAAVAYRRRRAESVGPLLLGSVFGLAAVAIQSAGDFGLHTPSVAVAAAVIAGHVFGARPEHRRSGPADPELAERRASPLMGWTAYTAAGVVLITALAVALSDWRASRVDQLRTAAAALRAYGPEGSEGAVVYLEAATRLRPDDAAAWNDLLAAHLEAAGERWQFAPADPAAPPRPAPRGIDREAHTTAALRVARTTRDLQPLYPAPHLVLGSYADRFARSELAALHFARAKTVAGYDSAVWLASGEAAARRGDWAGALADWRESLLRSPRRLQLIMSWVAGRLPPERIRAELLPDDPSVWFAATPFLFPDEDAPARRAWIKSAVDRWSAGPEPETLTGLGDWASALEALGDDPAALRVWRRAVERFPNEVAPHDRLAARLEAEEEYDQAIPELQWLIARKPDNQNYPERLAAVRHAMKLKADIDRP